MSERVALNLRLPKSLHRGLVALAEREYRSLNDQIVAILARAALDQLDPQRDDLASIAKRFAVACEPFMVLWDRLYPERQPQAPPLQFVTAHPETNLYSSSAQRRQAHQRLEAASAELIRALHAWEQSLVAPNADTNSKE